MLRPLTRHPSLFLRLCASCLLIAGFVFPAATSTDGPLPPVPVAIEIAEAAPPPVAVPLRLSIPVIGVDAPIEPVGVQEDGKLGVPEAAASVGWWKSGAKPGDKGTSVLDGHLDIGATKGVFWDLNKLKPGHRLSVTGADGVVRRFKVTATKLYDVETANLQEIFGRKSGKHLHLITCAGKWDTALDHYDQRFVVFAELIEPPKAAAARLAKRTM